MLEEALVRAVDGQYVAVIAPNAATANSWKHECASKWSGRIAGPKVYLEVGGSVTFETPESVRLDWHTMSWDGLHPSCCVLVDHYTIESRFGLLAAMLRRWDS